MHYEAHFSRSTHTLRLIYPNHPFCTDTVVLLDKLHVLVFKNSIFLFCFLGPSGGSSCDGHVLRGSMLCSVQEKQEHSPKRIPFFLVLTILHPSPASSPFLYGVCFVPHTLEGSATRTPYNCSFKHTSSDFCHFPTHTHKKCDVPLS